MSYQTYDRNPSGIVYFGTSSTDQVFESNSNFILDTSNSQLKVPNVVLSNGGKIGNASQTGILTFASDGIVTFSSGVVIAGDLIVQGSQVTLNTETLAIEDNIIVLNSNVTGSPTLDGGIEIERGSSTNVRLQWDEGNDFWSFSNNGTNYYRVSSNSSLMAGSGLVDGGLQDESRVLHIGAGTGISVAADQINVSPELISGRSEITSVESSLDYILIWDATDSALKKINRSNFVSGLGAMSSFTLAGDGGSSQTINDGNTVTISGGAGIATSAQATDTLKIDLDISEFSNVALASGDSFLVLDSDGSTEQRATVTQLGSYLAGTNVTAGGDGKLSVTNASLESVIFDSANFTDGTTVDFTVTAGQSVTAEVKTNSIGPTFLTTSVAGSGISGGNGSALSVVVDNSTLEINSNTLRIKDNGVTAAKLASNAVETNKLANNAVSFAKIVNSAADGLSVVGRSANSAGNFGEIAASTDGHVLRRSGTTLGFGTIATAGIDNSAITEVKRSRTVANVSSSVTLSSDVNLVTSGSGGVTVTLPSPVSGKIIYVKKVDTGAGVVTVSGGSATIDGASSKILYYQYESLSFVSNGTNWFIV